MQGLLEGLRGQQLAINLLIQLVLVDSLGEIRQLLSQNRPVMTESVRKTKLLKESHPEISVPDSIYGNDDRQSIYSADVSIAGVSALEFGFDDLIVNSKAYRRVLASAKAKAVEKTDDDTGVIEGDLIELSDAQTVLAVQEKNLNQDLESLIISQDKESTISPANTPPLHSHNNHDQAIPTVDLKDSILENIGSSSTNNRGHGVVQIAESNTKKDRTARKIGDYHIGGTIKEGHHSKVKLSWKIENGVQVAVKIIRKNFDQPAVDLPEIYHEVAILRHISHPNIVRLHEMLETTKVAAIILEYASGGELFDYVSNHRYAARRLFAQLVSGIGYLHLKGVAHRNLDLHNLLLDRNRNIIIAGFGSANTFNPDDELSDEIEYNLSNLEYVRRMELDKILPNGCFRGDLMRTKFEVPYFTAPELVLRNDSLYTSRKVDIWSCGIVLYAMLMGHEPFNDDPANPNGENIGLLYRYIVTTPLTFPSHVPPHPRDLLRCILVPDPRKRADLFEIARHSWLAEYSHLLEYITSSTAKVS